MELKDVENLAELARLDLSEEEKQSILADMAVSLDYVKVIESVELDEVVPSYDVFNAWRDDQVRLEEDYDKNGIIQQFPDSQEGFLKVKKIL